MPHFKCLACKGRLYGSTTMPDEPCRGCGATLEPVGELSEIVGFRLLEPHDVPAAAGARRLADRVDEMRALGAALSAPNPRSTRLET
jgi:hypothetical protein